MIDHIYINCRCSLLHAHLLSVCKYWINDTCILFHLPVVVGHGPMLMRDWCIWSWWRLVCFTCFCMSRVVSCMHASMLHMQNWTPLSCLTCRVWEAQLSDVCMYKYVIDAYIHIQICTSYIFNMVGSKTELPRFVASHGWIFGISNWFSSGVGEVCWPSQTRFPTPIGF